MVRPGQLLRSLPRCLCRLPARLLRLRPRRVDCSQAVYLRWPSISVLGLPLFFSSGPGSSSSFSSCDPGILTRPHSRQGWNDAIPQRVAPLSSLPGDGGGGWPGWAVRGGPAVVGLSLARPGWLPGLERGRFGKSGHSASLSCAWQSSTPGSPRRHPLLGSPASPSGGAELWIPVSPEEGGGWEFTLSMGREGA